MQNQRTGWLAKKWRQSPKKSFWNFTKNKKRNNHLPHDGVAGAAAEPLLLPCPQKWQERYNGNDAATKRQGEEQLRCRGNHTTMVRTVASRKAPTAVLLSWQSLSLGSLSPSAVPLVWHSAVPLTRQSLSLGSPTRAAVRSSTRAAVPIFVAVLIPAAVVLPQ